MSGANGSGNGHYSLVNDAQPGEAWHKRAPELATWTEKRCVNRRDISGGYRIGDDGKVGPFTSHDELTFERIVRHYRATCANDVLGLHTTARIGLEKDLVVCQSLKLEIDIDHHGEGPAPDANWAAARAWRDDLAGMGFHPLLTDSNGKGGFHLRVFFEEPTVTAHVRQLGRWLTRGWKERGLDSAPEVFPRQNEVTESGNGSCGNWLRLFGRHAKRDHWSRVWDGSEWLEGDDAIDFILDLGGDSARLIPNQALSFNPEGERKTSASSGGPASEDDVENARLALAVLNANAEATDHNGLGFWDSYDPWIMIGMTLFELGDVGLELWEEYSKDHPKYQSTGQFSCAEKWKTFGSAGTNGVTLATLFHYAKKYGFEFPGPKIVEWGSISGIATNNAAADSDCDKPIVNGKGFWVSCLHNSLLWITQAKMPVRHDRFRGIVLVDDKPLDDELVIAITAQIEASRRSAWSQEHVRSALVGIAHRNEFSSLAAYLDSLKWDGTPRISEFFHKAYGVEQSDYTKSCATVLFISGVARAFDPGCQADVMVVLIGKQGIGKSMGVARLSPNPDWYADDLGCDLFDKKAGEGLRGKWIFEFSEFSRINRATVDVVKAFISRKSDYYRPPYGRVYKDFPRTCIFVGTTNDSHPLQDIENRRYMPVPCVQVDMEWIVANRDQLWAEAVVRYRGGAAWWVTDPTLLKEVIAKQEEARQGDFWESVLGDQLGNLETITMARAAEVLKIPIDRVDRSTQTRIGVALRTLGYTKSRPRKGGKRDYEWSKPGPTSDPPF